MREQRHGMTDPSCDKNVFQIWRDGGEKLPFKVIRWTWDPAYSAFLVERIEVGKWPYGKAWGRFVRDGLPDATEEVLNGAGSFQWKMLP
jgi:hypothetical protein